MKVYELINTLKDYPQADVKISTDSFRRESVDTISTNLEEITLYSYDLTKLMVLEEKNEQSRD